MDIDAPKRNVVGRVGMPDTDDMNELARVMAVPLMRKSIELAMASDDLRSVLALTKELIDRGYGKAVAGEAPMPGANDVRAAWNELEGD